ncbi:MAG: hypothetical protein KA313_05795 [Pseudarcicella sp.]|nr:hypothetical protein [Pseudarcicella sp.]MBP6410594.1 hypothetical protein [Pseudarcicella sp.]
MKRLVIVLLFISNNIFAQLGEIAKIEITDFDNKIIWMHAFPHEDGLLNVSLVEKTLNDSWMIFNKYDLSLQKILWKDSLEVENTIQEFIYAENKNKSFWLIVENDFPNFKVISLNKKNGELEVMLGKLPSEFDITAFRVSENKAYLIGEKYEKSIIANFSFETFKTTFLNDIYKNNTAISNLCTEDSTDNIHVLLNEINAKHCGLIMKNYDNESHLINTNILPEIETVKNENKLVFITGQTLKLSENKTLLIGNYSKGCSEYSKGLYVTLIEDNEEKWSKMTPFIQFSNFFSHFSEKKQGRIKNKIHNKQNIGKDPEYVYRLNIKDVIKTPNGFVLEAEVYTLQSPAASSTSPVNIISKTAYILSHAIICEFNNEGDLIWDNTLNLNDFETYQLNNIVQLTQIDNSWTMAYLNNNELYYKTVHANKISNHIDKLNIFNHKLSPENLYFNTWNNHYLITGVIRNNSNFKEKNHDQYFIKKIGMKNKNHN